MMDWAHQHKLFKLLFQLVKLLVVTIMLMVRSDMVALHKQSGKHELQPTVATETLYWVPLLPTSQDIFRAVRPRVSDLCWDLRIVLAVFPIGLTVKCVLNVFSDEKICFKNIKKQMVRV